MNRGQREALIKHYSNNLSNYRTVVEDTKGKVNRYPTFDYNCMGYALGTFQWEELDYFDEYWDEDVDVAAWGCVQELVKKWGCRLIESPFGNYANERVIAFRMSYDDFHFARLNSDGVWTHKPGCREIREMPEEELFGDAWCPHREYPYVSEIYFLAVAA